MKGCAAQRSRRRPARAGARPQSLRLVPVVVPGGLGPHKYADRRRLLRRARPGRLVVDCDALVTDTDGSVLETGRGNLFVVTDDARASPRPSTGACCPA